MLGASRPTDNASTCPERRFELTLEALLSVMARQGIATRISPQAQLDLELGTAFRVSMGPISLKSCCVMTDIYNSSMK